MARSSRSLDRRFIQNLRCFGSDQMRERDTHCDAWQAGWQDGSMAGWQDGRMGRRRHVSAGTSHSRFLHHSPMLRHRRLQIQDSRIPFTRTIPFSNKSNSFRKRSISSSSPCTVMSVVLSSSDVDIFTLNSSIRSAFLK